MERDKSFKTFIKNKKNRNIEFSCKKKIPYVTDKSNFDYKFERVKSRKFLKLLKKMNFVMLKKFINYQLFQSV